MRWARAGVWERIFADLVRDKKNQYLMLDSTIVRAHQQAAAARKRGSGNKALGRSRGGLSTKIHLLTDEDGLPVDFRITPGQAAEYAQAVDLLQGQRADVVIANKGYNSAKIASAVEALGAVVVIPPRRHWKQPRGYDRILYKQRNRIERCFNRLKHFHRFSTRYCRTIEAFPPAPRSPAWIRLQLSVDTALRLFGLKRRHTVHGRVKSAVVKLGPIGWLHKVSLTLMAVMKPLGMWGVGGLALIDSALIPIPVSMDGVVIGYVANNHQRFFVYCVVAAAASALGSLVPFFVGRAGGELFLLKRINRERYECMRDRFEKQEFIAILIPAMLPPPTPLKLFEFAAGVFEMKALPFGIAIFCGKLTQFVVCSLLTIWFGPALVHSLRHAFHRHFGVVIGTALFGVLLVVLYIVRRVFDRRRGVTLPVEEGTA